MKNLIPRKPSSKKTIILITHRPDTLVHAGKICVPDKGKVAEEGTRVALISKQGACLEFRKKQAPVLNGPPE